MDIPHIPGLTVRRVLGAGSTATVYEARRDVDGWPCALKVFSGLDEDAVGRIRHEVSIQGSLRLPHLIRVHDIVSVGGDEHHLALVLDLVDGGSAGSLLRARGHCSPGEVATLIVPVLQTLAELHRRGITHGDISAGNVLISRDGRPMLTDLGAAALVGTSDPDPAGTEGYIAPEVVGGGPRRAASDVYATAALAWRLLTGAAPGPGLGRPQLTSLAPGLPATMAEAITSALSADPARRPDAEALATVVLAAVRAEPLPLPDGPDLAEQLTHRLRGEAAIRPGIPSPAMPPGAPGAGPTPEPPGRHRRPHPQRTANVARSLPVKIRRWAPILGVSLAVGILVGLLAGAARGWRPWPISGVHNRVERVAVTETSGPTAKAGPTAGTPTGAIGATESAAAGPPSRVVLRQADDLETAFRRGVEQRARAYATADTAALTDVYVRGSRIEQEDTTAIERLREAQVRYEGLSYQVRSVEVRRREPGRAVLRVIVDTSGFDVVGRDGRREASPPQPGVAISVTMQSTDTGWRLSAMGSPTG